jgi:hypothetical protein
MKAGNPGQITVFPDISKSCYLPPIILLHNALPVKITTRDSEALFKPGVIIFDRFLAVIHKFPLPFLYYRLAPIF